ncbi:extra-large guanine nucleotide-binding protein 1 isoform X2 [Vigna angularis]|uniref:extra-large guanine nucleotide-binding protein 1 isoform X2 n=1 Tax=Phaseolus angularis TaxID=3914 RepID=UPI0022B383CE|nr:extra-large guanine nucleotide-binding protein 1 isoform X2 [Vigna angularis]
MASLLKNLRPGVPSVHDAGGDFSYEYSFAEEYKGPPLGYSVPEVLPFNLDQVPFAPVAHSPPHNLSLPVIQPFRKTNAELASKTASVSSDPLSREQEDHDDDDDDPLNPKHVKRPSVVTFRNPETNEIVEDEEIVEPAGGESSSNNSKRVRPHAERVGKKGSCYRCLKGSRLTEREVCIVCSAKFCRNCVLRVMGSMPEGRKCVTCIGHRIDENKRGRLGKPSRMLKYLLSKGEMKQIMKDEMFCETNQIPAEDVIVNGEPLDWDQLTLLLTCSNPPKGLKPGFYWYDKASGFWGKEGQRPCQIISPQLEVGGHLQRNASNGKTEVTINGREITKEELWILKWARVPCDGTTDFWVSHDGSYMEVGQKNVKGHIWEKARLLYNVPFSETELHNIKLVIQRNLYRYLGIILEAREIFEESLYKKSNEQHVGESTSSGTTGEIIDTTTYSISPRLRTFSDWLLQYMMSGNLDEIFPAAAREYAPLVEELWRDAAIQATYNRRNEIKNLPQTASYFLERSVEISRIDYEPLDMDILYAEGITLSNGLSSMEFSFPVSAHEDSLDPVYRHDPLLRYQLIRVHPKSLGEKCKWLDMFEDTDVVLFSVALTDYDEYTVDSKGAVTNKILAARHLFQNIITHRVFSNTKFLLILTKFDLFEEKIEQVPLTQCEWFLDFDPVISHNHKTASISKRSNHPPLAQRAFQYIGMKFKSWFNSLTGRKLFVSLVSGLEPSTVDEALRYAREVMVWQKWDPSLRNEKSEITSTTFEASSEEKYNNYNQP